MTWREFIRDAICEKLDAFGEAERQEAIEEIVSRTPEDRRFLVELGTAPEAGLILLNVVPAFDNNA